MIVFRKGSERMHTNLGWLDSWHTFSFGEHHDPRHMGFRVLRVINDDRVEPGKGFGTHPHRDMEIITYVVDGELEHKDSMGNGTVIRAGEVQRMTAGTGVLHSEFNPSADRAMRLLQIWIRPEKEGLEPGYEQRAYTRQEKSGGFRVVASRDGRDGSVSMHQDVTMLAAVLGPGAAASHPVKPGRHAWLQIVTGSATIDGRPMEEGDGAAISDEPAVSVRADTETEMLLFDLP